MRRIRFSLATALMLLTYFCVMAALAGLVLRSLPISRIPFQKSTYELVVFAFMGFGLLSMAAIVGGYSLHRLVQSYLSCSWEKTTAVILPQTAPRFALDGGSRYSGVQFFRTRFQFEVDGRTLTFRLWTICRYKPGERVPVFVDQTNPERNCLDPGNLDTAVAVFVVGFQLLFGAVGMVMLLYLSSHTLM